MCSISASYIPDAFGPAWVLVHVVSNIVYIHVDGNPDVFPSDVFAEFGPCDFEVVVLPGQCCFVPQPLVVRLAGLAAAVLGRVVDLGHEFVCGHLRW